MLRALFDPCPPSNKCPRLSIPTNGITKVTIKVRRHRSTLGSREAAKTDSSCRTWEVLRCLGNSRVDRNGSPFCGVDIPCYLDTLKAHLTSLIKQIVRLGWLELPLNWWRTTTVISNLQKSQLPSDQTQRVLGGHLMWAKSANVCPSPAQLLEPNVLGRVGSSWLPGRLWLTGWLANINPYGKAVSKTGDDIWAQTNSANSPSGFLQFDCCLEDFCFNTQERHPGQSFTWTLDQFSVYISTRCNLGKEVANTFGKSHSLLLVPIPTSPHLKWCSTSWANKLLLIN